MAARKHKYKQRLAEVTEVIKNAYLKAKDYTELFAGDIEESENITSETPREKYFFWKGQVGLAHILLQHLIVDEAKEQARDKAVRKKKNAKKNLRKKERDDRKVWCKECLWCGEYRDAFRFRRKGAQLVCPCCSEESHDNIGDVVFGDGPDGRLML